MATGDPVCGYCGAMLPSHKAWCCVLKGGYGWHPYFAYGQPSPWYYSSPDSGWECPRCHKIHAPSVKECDCKPAEAEGNPESEWKFTDTVI